MVKTVIHCRVLLNNSFSRIKDISWASADNSSTYNLMNDKDSLYAHKILYQIAMDSGK